MHSKKRNLFNYILILMILIRKILYRNFVFIVGTPIHGNIGDQAIIYSEVKMFKEKFNLKVIEIESYLMKSKFKIIKKIIGNSPIFVHGGGFLGNLWEEEEEMFRTILKEFPNNKIIVLPQTCFFDKTDTKFFEESLECYSKHKNLIFFMREKYSLEFMRKNFPTCNVFLVPDIVLYNREIVFKNERENALCCFRNDKEKAFNDKDEIIEKLNECGLKVSFTDTVIPQKVFAINRKNVLLKKLKEFSKYKIVITDRLHGMVFAYLTKTPCLVIENKSYKVKGLFEWIKKSKFIKMYDSKKLKDDIDELLKLDKIEKINGLDDKFESLYKEIKKGVIDGK